MTGRTTAASLVVSVCLVLAAVAGGLPLASGPALAQSGSLELQDDITEQDDFLVQVTNLEVINTGYLVVNNTDNQHGAFEGSFEAGSDVVLSPGDLGGLNASETVEATLYESQERDNELDSEQTNVSGFNGSFNQSVYTATQGDTVELGVTISNPGDAETTENVSLVLDNNVGPVETRNVTVAAGGSKQFTMTWNTSGWDPADYEASLVSQYDSDELALAVVTVQPADPANFVVGINSTNSPVIEGDPLDVNVTVSNTGDKSDTQNITLTVDNVVEDNRSLTLDGGASETFTLTWQTQGDDAGTHLAEVASADSGAERDVVVEEPSPANFTVSLDSTNSPVTEGERLNVTATITNTGDEAGSQEIDLSIDGTSVNSTTVSLAGGESTPLTLSWQTGSGDAGTHEAAVSSANETQDTLVEVEEPPPAPPYFAVSLDSTNSPVTEGERLDVTATITNTGDLSDTQEVGLAIDGTEVDSTPVTLPGGDATTVTLSRHTGPGAAGSHLATVASANDSATSTVEVQAAPTPTRTTETPTRTTETPTRTTETPTTTTAALGTGTATGEGSDQPRWDVKIDSTTSPVMEGDPLQVTATLTNLGEDFASTELTLSVGSEQADVRAISLAGGAAETVTLTWGTESGDGGDHTAVVAAGKESASESVTVGDDDGATFDVEIESTTVPASDGESFSVTASITNMGSIQDTQEVSLVVGGVQQDSETVTLDPGASRTLEFSWESDEGRETTVVEISSEDDDATASVELQPPRAGGSPFSDPLLIGLLLLLLALVVVAVYYYVRRQQLHREQTTE